MLGQRHMHNKKKPASMKKRSDNGVTRGIGRPLSPKKKNNNGTPNKENNNAFMGQLKSNNGDLQTPPRNSLSPVFQGSPGGESRSDTNTFDNGYIGNSQQGNSESSSTSPPDLLDIVNGMRALQKQVAGLQKEVKRIPGLEKQVADLQKEVERIPGLEKQAAYVQKELDDLKKIVTSGEVVKILETNFIDNFKKKYSLLRGKEFKTLRELRKYVKKTWNGTAETDVGVAGFKLIDLDVLVQALQEIRDERNEACHELITGYRTDAKNTIIEHICRKSSHNKRLADELRRTLKVIVFPLPHSPQNSQDVVAPFST